MTNRSIEVLSDPEALAARAAELFGAALYDAVRVQGRFAVALSGGTTPRALYRILGAGPAEVDWSRTHLFWGDERCVSPDDPASNYRMAREALIDRVALPPPNVHRIRGEDDPAEGALAYEAELRRFFAPGEPSRALDLVLLGLGDDGHTASLFPGTAAVHERERWVLAHRVSAVPPCRITLTPPVLNAARAVIFLVSGAAKASIAHRVLDGPAQPAELPAQIIRPEDGSVRWLFDRAAARDLDPVGDPG